MEKIKLKLYLFLGKFSKYFREMANEHIKKRINDEILIRLNAYENHQLFKIIDIDFPSFTNTSFKIKIDIKYQNINFSFFLKYVNDSDIDRSFIINDVCNGENAPIIFNYYKYFESISNAQLLEFFERFK